MTKAKFLAALCVLSLAAGSLLARADDPPSDLAAKVSAKEIAHDVAAASKQGAQDVAAAAKRGTEKTKAALKPKTDGANKEGDSAHKP